MLNEENEAHHDAAQDGQIERHESEKEPGPSSNSPALRPIRQGPEPVSVRRQLKIDLSD
jgi:hypothetical protein